MPVISEVFTSGPILMHQLCSLTFFKKKMMESSLTLEVRETNFRNGAYSSMICLGVLLLASIQD